VKSRRQGSDGRGGSLIHDEFLAGGETDPRREFSETLLKISESIRA
jgi:hypothetical protein